MTDKKKEELHVEESTNLPSTDADSTEKDEGPKKDVPQVVRDAHENVKHIKLGWRSYVLLFVTCVALSAQVFAVSAPNTVVAFISRDLGDSKSMSGWILQGPLLMQSILSPSVGRFSDLLDRKWFVTLPPLVAMGGSILSAKAGDMGGLIGGGILIGLTLPSAAIIHAIQAEVLPLKYRTVGSALGFLGSIVGSYIGGIVAGVVTNASPGGWRIIFWIEAALHGVTALGFAALYWPTRRSDYPNLSLKEIVWLSDPIGSFFYIGGSTLILLALTWGGGNYAWNSAAVVASLVLGFLLIIAFGLYEWKGRSDGLIPHVFFESGPNFPVSVFALAIEGWILYSAITVVLPQVILNLGFEDNSFSVALRKLAYGSTALVFSLVVSFWATWKKDLKNPLLLTWTLFLVGTICMGTLKPGQGALQIFYTVICGLGQAGPLALLVPLIQYASPHEYLSTASGIAYSGRSIGGAFGTAVLNAIINGHLRSHLSAGVTQAALQAGLPPSSLPKLLSAMHGRAPKEALKRIPAITPAITAAALNASHWIYSKAYQKAWLSIVPFVVIAIVCLFFTKDVKNQMTDKIEASVEKQKVENDQA